MNARNDGRNPVEELAEEFLNRYRRGERPSLTEFVQRHPEMASEIRELFPALVMMEQACPAPEESDGAGARMTQGGRVPERLGDYRIVREIGRGGMGVVYEAEQEALGRRVALKVLPLQVCGDPVYLQRFRREARSAARLHHTNIVPVFDVGESEGTWYYAMQLIEGQSLDEVLAALKRLRLPLANAAAGDPRPPSMPALTNRLADGLLTGSFVSAGLSDADASGNDEAAGGVAGAGSTAAYREPAPTSAKRNDSSLSVPGDSHFYRSTARVGLQVAEALAYAHGQKVLHRDIKPSNLLLDSRGMIWVTDFGLAKSEGEDLTRSGDLVGTLRYMAPERFRGESDARSDIYGLGLTLYELVTLRPAFEGADRARLMRRIANDEPPRPRKLDPHVPRDLETIILKAIAKDPHHRYQTAGELTDDLRLFLADRPIRARRSSSWEYAWRWCRRNPLNAALIGIVLTLVLVVGIGVPVGVLISGERDRAVAAREEAGELLERARKAEAKVQLRSHLARAAALRHSGQIGQRFGSLREIRRAIDLAHSLQAGPDVFLEIRNEAIASLCLPDLDVAYTRPEVPPDRVSIAVDPAFRLYAYGDRNGVIHVRRIRDNGEACPEIRDELPRGNVALQFSPDGCFLHRCSDFGRSRLWRIDGPKPACVLEDDHFHLAFKPDGSRYAASYRDGSVRVFEPGSDKCLASFATGLKGNLGVQWNPKHPQLLVGGAKDWIIVDLENGRLSEVAAAVPRSAGTCMAWHPDGRVVAVTDPNHWIHLWDSADDRPVLLPLKGHQWPGARLQFNHSGDRLLSTDWSGCWRFWDTRTGEQILFAPASDDPCFFSPDDELVGPDMTPPGARFFHFRGGHEFRTLNHLDESLERIPYRCVANPALDPTRRLLAVAAEGAGVVLVDLEHLQEVGRVPATGEVGFLSDGSLLTLGSDGLYRWPVSLTEVPVRLGPPERVTPLVSVDMCGTSPEGRVLAIPRNGNGAVVLLRDSGRRVKLGPQADVRYCAVSRDGRWVATGSHWLTSGDGAKVWDARTGALRKSLPVGPLCAVEFSPDGKWLLTCGGGPRLWAVDTLEEGPRLGGTVRNARAAFSEDGRLLALGDDAAGVIRLVVTATGEEVARLTAPVKSRLQPYGFTPRQRQVIAVGLESGAIHVFDLRAIRSQLAELGLDWGGEPIPPPATPSPPQRIQVDTGDYGMAPGDKRAYWEAQAGLNGFLLALDPRSFQAALARGHARVRLGDHEGAADDFYLAAILCPPEGRCLFAQVPAQELNNRAWRIARTPGNLREQHRALELARKAVELVPEEWSYRNTLGVILYRLGEYAPARDQLERSLRDSDGEAAGFNLVFLSMCYQRLGMSAKARECYDRALGWVEAERAAGRLPAAWTGELAAFNLEADAVLKGR
jgi:serine/threonine protein kinase/WD40 repeat protein